MDSPNLNEIFPENHMVQFKKTTGKLDIDPITAKRTSFLFMESISPPDFQPNYSKAELEELIEKKEIKEFKIKNLSLFYNPTSRGGKGKKLIEDFKKKYSIKGKSIENIQFFDTFDFENLKTESEKARTSDDTCIAVCGGDGTINMMISKLLEFSKDRIDPIPIIVIPFGTGNDFYASIGITYEHTLLSRWSKALKLPIDIGLMKYGQGSEIKDRIFTCQIGFAFSAESVKLGNKMGIFGKFKYKVSAFLEILRKKPVKLKITFDDHITIDTTDIDLLQIQNTQLVGGGLRLCPYAQLNDGLMDVLIGFPMSRTTLIGLFNKAKAGGSHIFNREVAYYRCKKLKVEFEGTQLLQVDGDLIEVQNSIEASILPSLVSYVA